MNSSAILAVALLLAPVLFHLCAFLLARLSKDPKLSPSEQSALLGLSKYVVPAVEQTCGLLSGAGKKAEATRVLSSIFSELGVSVSPTMIEAAIESAVYALNASTDQTQKLPVVSPPSPSR
jgi:hypothetical protein